MAAFLITILLFVLPLIVIPFGISPFEAPKVILFEIFTGLLIFIQIIHFKKIHLKKYLNPQLVFILILFILSLDDLLLFPNKGAFFGNPYRLQGIFLLWNLLIFSQVTRGIKMHLVKIIIPLSFFCLFLGTIILGVNQSGRAFGTLGEPNALAATAVFIFPFIFFPYKWFIKLGSLLTTITIILLSGSRAGLIAFFIQIIFILLHLKFKLSIKVAIIISIILISLSLTLPFTQSSSWFENREQVWQTSFKAGLDSLLIGHGFGSVQDTIHKTSVKLNNNVQYQVVDSSHNFLLDYWIQGGAVAVFSILMLIGLSIHGLISHRRFLELTAFLGLITTMLFNPLSVVNLLAFWWLIGQGFDKITYSEVE